MATKTSCSHAGCSCDVRARASSSPTCPCSARTWSTDSCCLSCSGAIQCRSGCEPALIKAQLAQVPQVLGSAPSAEDDCSAVYTPTPEGPLLAQTWDMHGSAMPYVMMLGPYDFYWFRLRWL